MNPQNPMQGGASNPQRGQQKEGSQGRAGKDTPRTEPTHPSSTNPSQQPSEREHGREVGPRFDDRPGERRESDREAETREENEGPAGVHTKPREQRPGERGVKASPGLPNYGDREPGDPRRVDVEAERPQRRQGGSVEGSE